MTATVGTSTLTVRDKHSPLTWTLNLDFATTTPQEVIDHLLAEGHILRVAPDTGQPLTYKLSANNAELQLDVPLAHQGIAPGSTVWLLTTNLKG